MKQSRANADSVGGPNPDSNLVQIMANKSGTYPSLNLMTNPGLQSNSTNANFWDKLMNKVHLVKNIGINDDCLDADYEGLNDEEDVAISRENR